MPRRLPERTDFVVVGSGVAGLRAAISLAEAGAEVLVLTKDAPRDSTSDRAQGGIAVALSDDDEIALHYEDTLRAGAGLSEPAAARALVEDGPRRILELIEWGAEFDRQGVRLAFTLEAAHSARRVLHAGGDATGREIVRALLAKSSTYPRLIVAGASVARDLWAPEGACRGVFSLDETDGATRLVEARAVLLATGGACRVYRENTNPPQATGDGIAMAWLAGAELMDMEFVQFHPTTLHVPGQPRWLLTEALRGEGGILTDAAGRRFMKECHPDAELAPRDVVSRGITRELARSGESHVRLHVSHLDPSFLRARFPGIDTLCRRFGIDFTRDPIPVVPAAHYCMGGVRTDLDGRSSLPGLYAAGETACTGVHGANRLASNSLLEGLVFGARVAAAMRLGRGGLGEEGTPAEPPPVVSREVAAEVSRRVEEIAWERLGIVRDGEGLEGAARDLDALAGACLAPEASREGIEARNRWIVARAIADAALLREESRGAHYRGDRPAPDDARFLAHTVQRAREEPRLVPVGQGPLGLSESPGSSAPSGSASRSGRSSPRST